jgi:hypothetical protein
MVLNIAPGLPHQNQPGCRIHDSNSMKLRGVLLARDVFLTRATQRVARY